MNLEQARRLRQFKMSDNIIDENILSIELAGTAAAERTMANPHSMKKLAPLLKYYARQAHPFYQCVADNRKRFGPLVNRYCAVIVDILHGGNTHWRKGGRGQHKNVAAIAAAEAKSITASDDQPPEITDEMVEILEQLPQPAIEQLREIYQEAREVAHA